VAFSFSMARMAESMLAVLFAILWFILLVSEGEYTFFSCDEFGV
jgi:hypothetical protein